MISRHEYLLEIIGAGHQVSPVSGTVTLDESWSPYVQASLTIPLPNDPDVLNALDPRTGSRVRITLAQRFGGSEPLSVLSEQFAGMTLADVSAAWDGLNLSGISGQYGRPYNAFGTRPSTNRRLFLGVRDRNVRYSSATVDLQLASDEARLMDLANLDRTPRAPEGVTVRGCVQLVLDAIGAVLTPGTDDGVPEADAVSWMPGQTAWDYVDAIVKAAGLRLWCDEAGRWLLTQPLAPTEGALAISGSSVTELEEDVSRDEGWFDSVVVIYRWRDSGGVERERYDIASLPNASRTYTVEYNRPWPGDGAAAAILARARGRGRIMAASGVSNYDATTGQALTVSTAYAPIQTGLTTRVEWDLATDEMQVRSRDLVDTPPSAWALIPPGYAWEDIPVGTDWTELNPEEI